MRGLIAGFLIVASVGVGIGSTALVASVDEIPSAFLPFESMIGGWKGTAASTANRVKGWPESHAWAWKFEQGKPVGLKLTFEGSKTLVKGAMSFDLATKKYRLGGTDPGGKAVTFVGSFGQDGKTLTLDRVGGTSDGGKERLVIRPNSNKIRYTLQLDRQEPGAPQYKTAITVGLTKDGEAFAAGAGGADLPKCIMTGGASSITVSYQGKSYPVCCTGCRDEFNDNPEKYARIADLAAKATSSPDKSATKEKAAAKGKDDGSFDGLFDETKTPKDDPEAKASKALEAAQKLEKSGKKSQALAEFRKLVKDQPDTEAAKTATARIKALEGTGKN